MVSKIEVDTVVNQSGDQDSGLDLSTNDVVKVKTANTERMRVDASGNVGIGTASPTATFHVSGDNPRARFTDTPNSVNFDIFMGDDNATVGMQTNHALKFMTNDAQRMSIDSGGNTIFGGSASASISSTNSDEKCVIEGDGEFILQGAAKVLMYLNRNQTAGEIVSIRQGNTAVGGIDANSSSVDFNTSSDYRLKENVTTSWDATTRLKQLKPVRFSWKVDSKSEADTDGFLAHEVNAVVPQATKGTKDEVVTQKGIDEGTYPKDAKVGDAYMQSIDHSKLVPLLVKTIQELEARIVALESK
tara:strand:+ start:745 stop:1650 length:906 start_codon:yes stop_codon:yes gene_type:complete